MGLLHHAQEDGRGRMRKQRKKFIPKCLGCGHRLSQHREYINDGRNRRGSRLVCIVSGCGGWDNCHVAAQKPTAAGQEPGR